MTNLLLFLSLCGLCSCQYSLPAGVYGLFQKSSQLSLYVLNASGAVSPCDFGTYSTFYTPFFDPNNGFFCQRTDSVGYLYVDRLAIAAPRFGVCKSAATIQCKWNNPPGIGSRRVAFKSNHTFVETFTVYDPNSGLTAYNFYETDYSSCSTQLIATIPDVVGGSPTYVHYVADVGLLVAGLTNSIKLFDATSNYDLVGNVGAPLNVSYACGYDFMTNSIYVWNYGAGGKTHYIYGVHVETGEYSQVASFIPDSWTTRTITFATDTTNRVMYVVSVETGTLAIFSLNTMSVEVTDLPSTFSGAVIGFTSNGTRSF